MKKGLIMEGGAMRGMFTCGVIDVLMENNIKFDGGAGISAGAVFGCNYKSHQIGRGVRYNKKYCNDKRYCSVRSLLKTGDLYNNDFCYHELPDKLDPFDRITFKSNPMEFYIGATNIENGEVVFHKCSDGKDLDIEWMRASASMPIVSKPVKIADLKLLDGGIVCPVPYKHMEDLGYDRNVIILTQPKDYRKKKKSSFFMNLLLSKYKPVKEAMKKRYLVYNNQMEEIDKKELDKTSFVIRPPMKLNIGKTEKDPKVLEEVYQIGRKVALEMLDDIKKFLNE